MTYVVKVVDDVVIGLPLVRPASVTLDSGHDVGCGHWTDAELAEIAGLYPVVNGYDPALHVATGGGELVDGGGAIAYVERPITELQAERIANLKEECSRRILAVWPEYKQRSAALGVYGADPAAACTQWIAGHVAVCDVSEAAIKACRNLSDLDKVTAPEWPTETVEEDAVV